MKLDKQQLNQEISLVVKDKEGNIKAHKVVKLKNGVKSESDKEV